MGRSRANAPLSDACPCESGQPFARCCGPCLEGERLPLTAEALMRSRYTANCRGDLAYLRETWHPETRPPGLTLDPAIRWIGLKILATAQGRAEDEAGTVHFQARYKLNGQAGRLEEISRFEKLGDRWLYRDGDLVEKPRKTGRRGE